MDIIIQIIIFSFIAGFTIFIGGFLSRSLNIRNKELREEMVHFFVAFGGGILISAVAFALVPRAISELSILPVIVSFLLGSVLFLLLDKFITEKAGSYSQLMAMLMDFIPEALAMGSTFAYDRNFGFLLAVFIALQNFPEGFNSYRELIKHRSSFSSLMIMFFLSFAGVFAALIGYLFLKGNPKIIASIMLFAGGGITYLMFQDIAPMSKMKGKWVPPLGASLGFLVGIIGSILL